MTKTAKNVLNVHYGQTGRRQYHGVVTQRRRAVRSVCAVISFMYIQGYRRGATRRAAH